MNDTIRLEDQMSDIKAKPDPARQQRPEPVRRGKKPATAQIDNHIGRELRQLYAAVLEEPIPERFLTLLQSLEQGSHPSKKEGDA
jgi:Anti-sigma factor NepR